MTHTVKGFWVVNEEVDIFWNSLALSMSQWISGSFASSKLSLYIWKFSVHVLLKSSLKDFEHYLTSMWNACNCPIVEHSLAPLAPSNSEFLAQAPSIGMLSWWHACYHVMSRWRTSWPLKLITLFNWVRPYIPKLELCSSVSWKRDLSLAKMHYSPQCELVHYFPFWEGSLTMGMSTGEIRKPPGEMGLGR